MDRALALLEPFGTLERPLAKGPRFGALGTPARLLRPLYCSLAGDIISVAKLLITPAIGVLWLALAIEAIYRWLLHLLSHFCGRVMIAAKKREP